MKQKYALNIAGMEINVVSDASPDEIETVSGILDRKMREIYLVSHCPKTEAALLCAMSFCADRLSLQENNDELDTLNRKYAQVVEKFQDKVAELSDEIGKLKNENAILRSLITKDAPVAPDPISPAEFLAQVADAQTQSEEPAEASAEAGEAEASVEAPAENPAAPAEEPIAVPEKPAKKSRVGSMFDLLSFNEVD